MPDQPPSLRFHYLKSSDYKEVSCDGAMGGVTPAGKLWLALYSERYPLPRSVDYAMRQIDEQGGLEIDTEKSPASMETREGVIRNVEVGAYMSLKTAIELRDWLSTNIDRMSENEK